MSNTRLDLEERCEKCAHFHRLKHNFKKGIGFEESTCCDVLLHLPDSTDDTKPWVQEVSRLGMCEMFTEVKQDKTTTKNDLAVDCVSRKAVLDAIDSKAWEFCDYLISKGRNDEQKPVSHFADNLRECVREDLPSVTPQPKTGHWIEHEHNGIAHIECSECSSWFLRPHLIRNRYCPNCGAKMAEKEG